MDPLSTCPACARVGATVRYDVDRRDYRAECRYCGCCGPFARSVDIESMPNLSSLWEPHRDAPTDEHIARVAWNRISHRCSLGGTVAHSLTGGGS